uniref:Uncharacterized protein n=1 Tax=Setaria viridis TaxID=4556 RepID=A0A4U6UPI0_SETVI|nr:hypothetical protein SEVIR_5G347400v2 [Setaria viridis]TKW17156.1 hypothetical protein SEVIR_5G347400v2 [Setaria viridis]
MDMWRSFGCVLTLQSSSGHIRILSLRSGSDDLVVVCDYFVRFALHLLICPSWCSSVTLAGLSLVDWVLLVRQPATEPGDCEDCPARSMEKWHASRVLLMGFEDLFIDWVPAVSFILGSSSLREMKKARLVAMTVGSGEDRWVLLLWTSMQSFFSSEAPGWM